MAETPAKRMREAKKRRQEQIKAERKRMRKEGVLGHDHSGLFMPGEVHREVEDTAPPPPPPAPEAESEAAPNPSPTQR